MSSGDGQTTNFAYISNTLHCVSHHWPAETSSPKPADWPRGWLRFNAISNSQVADNPTYSGHDRFHAFTNEPATNARSNKNTRIGAETITSFESIPHAHAATAKMSHGVGVARIGKPLS